MQSRQGMGLGIFLGLLAALFLMHSGSAAQAVPLDCAAPVDDAQRVACANYAQEILETTILIRVLSRCPERPEADYWRFDSHATILDDHTLLTHDHFRILADPKCRLDLVVLYSASGDRIACITDADELSEINRQIGPKRDGCRSEACTLILEQPYLTGRRTMRLAHLAANAYAEPAAYGPAVAQVNWRGLPGTTFVQWTRVNRSEPYEGVPALMLDTAILAGASGGGVFMMSAEGLLHVGNSWYTRVDGSGSIAAINPT